MTAISSNGCPNTTGTVTCKATACPNAKITFPNKVITQCLTPTLPLISLPYTIANNLPNEVPTVMWSSSNPLTNSAINNAANPATFNPQIAKRRESYSSINVSAEGLYMEGLDTSSLETNASRLIHI
ncbi:MAG: hypothetical protein IPJ39_05550 [Saprospiraceae bacterium]|nr:hypothetical protein [Saprospiraceae bacterium]